MHSKFISPPRDAHICLSWAQGLKRSRRVKASLGQALVPCAIVLATPALAVEQRLYVQSVQVGYFATAARAPDRPAELVIHAQKQYDEQQRVSFAFNDKLGAVYQTHVGIPYTLSWIGEAVLENPVSVNSRLLDLTVVSSFSNNILDGANAPQVQRTAFTVPCLAPCTQTVPLDLARTLQRGRNGALGIGSDDSIRLSARAELTEHVPLDLRAFWQISGTATVTTTYLAKTSSQYIADELARSPQASPDAVRLALLKLRQDDAGTSSGNIAARGAEYAVNSWQLGRAYLAEPNVGSFFATMAFGPVGVGIYAGLKSCAGLNWACDYGAKVFASGAFAPGNSTGVPLPGSPPGGVEEAAIGWALGLSGGSLEDLPYALRVPSLVNEAVSTTFESDQQSLRQYHLMADPDEVDFKARLRFTDPRALHRSSNAEAEAPVGWDAFILAADTPSISSISLPDIDGVQSIEEVLVLAEDLRGTLRRGQSMSFLDLAGMPVASFVLFAPTGQVAAGGVVLDVIFMSGAVRGINALAVTSAVPEPDSFVLLALGLAGVLTARRSSRPGHSQPVLPRCGQ